MTGMVGAAARQPLSLRGCGPCAVSTQEPWGRAGPGPSSGLQSRQPLARLPVKLSPARWVPCPRELCWATPLWGAGSTEHSARALLAVSGCHGLGAALKRLPGVKQGLPVRSVEGACWGFSWGLVSRRGCWPQQGWYRQGLVQLLPEVLCGSQRASRWHSGSHQGRGPGRGQPRRVRCLGQGLVLGPGGGHFLSALGG